MRRRLLALLCALASTTLGPLSATVRAEVIFDDNFESSDFFPIWGYSHTQGNHPLLSTDFAHSGAQSVELINTLPNQRTQSFLLHPLDSDPGTGNGSSTHLCFGQVSVWLFDNGAGSTGNLASFNLGSNGGPDGNLSIAAPEAGNFYMFNIWGAWSTSTVARTRDWHLLSIDSTETHLTMSIDGITIYTGAGGFPFKYIQLQMDGFVNSPAAQVYWDDVHASFTVGQAVPEPASSTLLAAGIALLFYRMGNKKRDVRLDAVRSNPRPTSSF